MTDMAVTVRDVTKTYRFYKSQKDRLKEAFHPFRKIFHQRFNALTGVSLDVNKGETVGIVGANGSGKSTLLQLICGITRPTLGDVHTHGRISALLELGAGFNPEFSGRENIYINAAIMGFSDREIDARVPDIIQFSEIGEFIDKPVKTYSSGMYVRLAFSIAINVNPDILVIDEALSVGDIFFQAKCFSRFKSFQEKGVTILLVTHDLGAVTRYCNRAVLLDHGRVKCVGDSKTVVDEYQRMIVGFGKAAPVESEKRRHTHSPAGRDGNRQEKTGENRYGNGSADIFDAGIYGRENEPVTQLLHGIEYDFRLRVRCLASLENPVLSFTIKDPRGFDISGSNTLYKKVHTGAVGPDDVLEVTFRQKMMLNPGEYLLSFGCAGFEEGEYVIYDRRFDFMAFRVISHMDSVGIFDMDSRITVRKHVEE